MKVKKIKLADLPLVYAVTSIKLHGQDYFLAASELEGEGSNCLLLHPKTGKCSRIWSRPGGVMSLIPVPGDEGAFLSIDEFYPVFKSEKASINLTRLTGSEECLHAQKKNICNLPYTHRITLLEETDGLFLAAANLCRSKKFVEDWSDPGGIHIGAYGDHVVLQEVYHGLSKNHGMYTQKTPAGDVLWIGAHEGLFRCSREGGRWITKQILNEEISDLWMYDIDGDGEQEIAVIRGFHGNEAAILKNRHGKYEQLAAVPLNFAHVVWLGALCGSMYMVTASRGGEMELAMHQIQCRNGGCELATTVLDKGTGATQIAVLGDEREAMICAANHESGTVDLYMLEK